MVIYVVCSIGVILFVIVIVVVFGWLLVYLEVLVVVVEFL